MEEEGSCYSIPPNFSRPRQHLEPGAAAPARWALGTAEHIPAPTAPHLSAPTSARAAPAGEIGSEEARLEGVADPRQGTHPGPRG